jgi:hypothetical protein
MLPMVQVLQLYFSMQHFLAVLKEAEQGSHSPQCPKLDTDYYSVTTSPQLQQHEFSNKFGMEKLQCNQRIL